ncbi:hypothetical protein [Bartonella pachyuromydis]|uniref:hypothetical protein n=1 Tax=Bartonella pachyuromydis TaxID=931097 RepID=UPI0031E60161
MNTDFSIGYKYQKESVIRLCLFVSQTVFMLFVAIRKDYLKEEIGSCCFSYEKGETVGLYGVSACFFCYFLYNRKNDKAERRNS